ncbi:MAG: dephospho-CoA kinase [Alkalibacterium sp.]|nr:dephospho-CoA kinase [Alkalibacterium sp.]TVP92336.1 MAG: dephospho-CoA kinase [Alkalibacterium sp.]
MTYFLGLTGGIASGKSTASQFFKSKGIPVIDADVIAREAMETDQPAFRDVVDSFGTSILTDEGNLDRKALGQLIFNDEAKRKKLNAIVQEDIRQRINRQKKDFSEKDTPLVILDIPLLFEADYEDEVNAVMVVYVDRETQIKRLMSRDDISEEDAVKRIDAQYPIEEKAEKADVVINNNYSIKETQNQLADWIITNGFQAKDINVI